MKPTNGRFPHRVYMGIILVIAACVLLTELVAAQGLTGTLFVTVQDEQRAAVPGALVRVTSQALIGGPREIRTSDEGRLWLPDLPPGLYRVDIEMQGFASYHAEDIRIGAGATIDRLVVLKVGAAAQSIVVQESGSRIEARDSGFESRFGPEYLETIPTTRYSMFNAIRSAPGVSPTSPASGRINTVSVFGGGVNENMFLIDGTNFTCPCQGVSRAEPSIDMIQEVQVQSAGASAEFGNIQGAVFNVVTKQGGNNFSYDASYYGQPSGLTSQPVQLRIPGSSAFSSYERIKYRDVTTNLGGPVRRDRVWFFSGYQHLRDYDSQPGADPRFPRTYQQDKLLGKLTWQLKPNLRLVGSFHDEFWVNPQIPTFVTPFEATQRQHAHVPTMTFGHLTHTLSARTLWDLRVGRFVYTRKDDPSSGNTTIPNRSDRVTGVNSGGPQQIGSLTLLRTTSKATVSHYRPRLLGVTHLFKGGTEVEKGEHRGPQIIPTGIRYVDDNGQPFQTISRDPAISGGQFITAALFATDAITLSDRLTVNIGLRFDHSRAISQDLRAIDLLGRETGDIVHGLGTMYTWNVLSPRLGVTAKLSGDGRTLLRASYGRFHQGILTAEVSQNHPGLTPTTTMAFEPATGGYTRFVSRVDTKTNLEIDRSMRSPKTDAYSIGVDRDLGGRISLALAYIHKTGTDYIAWTDLGGQYRQETRTMFDGRSVPVQVLVNSTDARLFQLTNPDGYSMTYNGLVIAAEKRMANDWFASGSYTYSKVYGLNSASNATAGGQQLSTVANVPPGTFGQDPNDLTNARGRLPNDRPHMLRAMGKANVPWTGLGIAVSMQHFSGKPWAPTAQVALPQGDRRILLEPRGSRRLSSQSLLDLRVSKTIFSRESARIELLVDVFNVLNDTAEEELATDNLYSTTNFGLPTVFMDPRRAMFGVRVHLGGN